MNKKLSKSVFGEHPRRSILTILLRRKNEYLPNKIYIYIYIYRYMEKKFLKLFEHFKKRSKIFWHVFKKITWILQ